MGKRAFDTRLLGELAERGVPEGRVLLLQGVLAGVDPAAVFCGHASGLAGLVTELPRVAAALAHYEVERQPTPRQLNRLCVNAAERVRAVVAAWGSEPVLVAAREALDDARRAIAADGTGVRAGEFAARVDAAVAGLPGLLRRRFTRAWAERGGDLVADQVACLLAVADRDPAFVVQDLVRVAARLKSHREVEVEGEAEVEGEVVWSALLPDATDHQVALVVRGTGALSDLPAFEPDARQWPLRAAADARWGPTTDRLRHFVAGLPPGEGTLVTLRVRARDRPSAARLARRRLVEALDQYHAGNRLLDLRLDPVALVAEGHHTWQEAPAVPRRTREARPLTVTALPDRVRRALRMARVASSTDSPHATAALSWSAVEASGVQNRSHLAAALSLQCLRQELVLAHRRLRWSLSAAAAHRAWLVTVARSHVDHTHRSVRRCPPGHPRLAALRRELADAEAGLTRALEPAARHPHDDASPGGLDVNRWAWTVSDVPTTDEHVLRAREALAALTPHPLARHDLARWRALLGSPEACEHRLTERGERMITVLDGLYATRNLTLHSGVFTGSGDAVHGAGARKLADVVLEILGNWYGRGGTGTPEEVIAELGRRRRAIAGVLPVTLDFAALTGPDFRG
ncbi:hypothetical protein V5P93_003716 [Actinokineospora auranticolor]|uniref:Uncharacterized protein n=1 Tax=Actinokineospora auranticolor TaxID=155976 RepID=A0A2S6GJ63_9PSEU|nr:hypothetical protein [Actinokineospora auranticolor]PPK65278.1 hypothetical protein CLV40_115125 [Actinokineospora auranticolor]